MNWPRVFGPGGTASDPAADVDGQNVVKVQDIFDFLADWLEGS